MKKILLSLLICSSVFAMDHQYKQEKKQQAKEDAFVIAALMKKHNIFFTQSDREQGNCSVFCVADENGIEYKIQLNEKALANTFGNTEKQKKPKNNNMYIWGIGTFKQLLLMYFDETENSLQQNIQEAKNVFNARFN